MQKIFKFIIAYPLALALLCFCGFVFVLMGRGNSQGSTSSDVINPVPSKPPSQQSTQANIQKTCVTKEKERICSACNQATVKLVKADCSEETKTVEDPTCISVCPVPVAPAPAPKPQPAPQPVTPPPAPPAAAYVCNCNKTCTQISTCAEAQYQLHVCGCNKRDGDNDGIACDGAPLNCD